MAIQPTTESKNRSSSSVAGSEREIRNIIESVAAAFRERDIEKIISFYAPDVVAFDIEPPLQYLNKNDYKKSWDILGEFQDGASFEPSELNIRVNENLGFSNCLFHFTGTTKKDSKRFDFWMRNTACFEKINGQWLIVHEHVSVPVNIMEGKSRTDLKPEILHS